MMVHRRRRSFWVALGATVAVIASIPGLGATAFAATKATKQAKLRLEKAVKTSESGSGASYLTQTVVEPRYPVGYNPPATTIQMNRKAQIEGTLLTASLTNGYSPQYIGFKVAGAEWRWQDQQLTGYTGTPCWEYDTIYGFRPDWNARFDNLGAKGLHYVRVSRVREQTVKYKDGARAKFHVFEGADGPGADYYIVLVNGHDRIIQIKSTVTEEVGGGEPLPPYQTVRYAYPSSEPDMTSFMPHESCSA